MTLKDELDMAVKAVFTGRRATEETRLDAESFVWRRLWRWQAEGRIDADAELLVHVNVLPDHTLDVYVGRRTP